MIEKAEGQPVMATLRKELQELSSAEKIVLAEDLWDSVVDTGSSPPIPDAQREELDRRLDACDKTSEGSSWSEVKDRLRRKS